MAPDPSIEAQLAPLRKDISDLQGTARVTKHEAANIAQRQIAGELRMDKIENRIEAMNEKVSDKLEIILNKIADLNTAQQKSFGFYAGIGTVFTAGLGLLLALGKLLFGAAQ